MMRFQNVGQPNAAAGVTPRGAAPVGYLRELPAVELAAILYLRLWCGDDDARDRVAQDFRMVLGFDAAVVALMDLDALMLVTLENARRPLMRHDLQYCCFGGDECCFANMIAAAAAQDGDDAMLFACNLMTGSAACEAVRLARALGQVFLRIARTPPPEMAPTHTPRTHTRH